MIGSLAALGVLAGGAVIGAILLVALALAIRDLWRDDEVDEMEWLPLR